MQVIGLGVGGHAKKAVVEILRSRGGHEIVGLLDPNRQLWGTGTAGASVAGDEQPKVSTPRTTGGVRRRQEVAGLEL